MIENNVILTKSSSNNSKNVLIVDSFKLRKVYRSKSDNIT